MSTTTYSENTECSECNRLRWKVAKTTILRNSVWDYYPNIDSFRAEFVGTYGGMIIDKNNEAIKNLSVHLETHQK